MRQGQCALLAFAVFLLTSCAARTETVAVGALRLELPESWRPYAQPAGRKGAGFKYLLPGGGRDGVVFHGCRAPAAMTWEEILADANEIVRPLPKFNRPLYTKTQWCQETYRVFHLRGWGGFVEPAEVEHLLKTNAPPNVYMWWLKHGDEIALLYLIGMEGRCYLPMVENAVRSVRFE